MRKINKPTIKPTMTVEDLILWLEKAVERDENILRCRVENFHGGNELKGCISVCGEQIKADGTTGVLLLCFEKTGGENG